MQNQIPKNWQKDNLENILTMIIDHRGITPKKLGGDWSLSGISALSAKNIKIGRIINEQDIRYVSQQLYDRWMPEKIEKGDILLTSEAPLGEVYFLKEKKDYVLSQRLFGLRTNKTRLNPRYLYYYLQGSIGRQELLRRLSGTAAEGIRQAELRQISISFPESIEEQEQIADILSSFDDKIEINNKIAKTLDEMAQAIFKEWFTRNISSDWETSKFENYAKLEYGKALQEGKRIPGKVLVFGSSGQVGTHNEKLCTGPGIVVGRKGNVGSVFWIDEDFYPIDTTFYINPKISFYYIYFVLKNMRFHTGDSAVPGLNRESVHSLEILIPDEHILKEFENIVSSMFKKLAEIKKENQKLAALRDLLLPKLMKGEIRV